MAKYKVGDFVKIRSSSSNEIFDKIKQVGNVNDGGIQMYTSEKLGRIAETAIERLASESEFNNKKSEQGGRRRRRKTLKNGKKRRYTRRH